MPVQTTQVDLAAVGTQVLVRDGNRITGVTVFPPRNGAPFVLFLDLGNAQVIGPITSDGVLKFSGALPIADRREGLKVLNDAAQAGVVVPVMVSYDRGETPEGGSIEFARG
jgi:hypothetical protein